MHWDTDQQRNNFAGFFERKLQRLQNNIRIEEAKKHHERVARRKWGPAPAPMSGPGIESQPQHVNTLSSEHAPIKNIPELVSRISSFLPSKQRDKHKWPRPDRNSRLLFKSKLAQVLYNAAKLFEIMDSFRDRKLMEEYLLKDPQIHPRRTLDQSYYWALRNTRARDRDQVVYKKTSARPDMVHRYNPEAKMEEDRWGCSKEYRPHLPGVRRFPTSKAQGSVGSAAANGDARYFSPQANGQTIQSLHNPVSAMERGEADYFASQGHDHTDDGIKHPESCSQCREDIQKVPRLIMVDQLWMWILDHETIITCFPRRYGVNRKDPSGVHKSIRTKLGNTKRYKIRSAYDLALIIINECTNIFFDPTKTDERQPQVLDIFSEAIGDMVRISDTSYYCCGFD